MNKNKKIIGILICTLFISVPLLSASETKIYILDSKETKLFNQPPPIQWQRTYGYPWGGSANSVHQTSDGGYIAAGTAIKESGLNPDIFLVKTDASGTAAWLQTYPNLPWPQDTGFDFGYCGKQTSDGGYIIAGTRGVNFGWVIKTDSNGVQQWNKLINSSGGWDTFYGVQQTTDGGYVIVGGYRYIPFLSTDMWIIKTDANGNLQWDRKTGGPSNEYGYSIRQTTDGGYIIVGDTTSYGAGLNDVRLVKLYNDGSIDWIQDYGGSSEDIGNSVCQTSDSGYIITGYTNSFGAGMSDVWLIKTDSKGNKVWDKTFGTIFPDQGSCVRQTIDGGYIIVGTTYTGNLSSNVYLIKTDATGTKEWDTTYGITGMNEGKCVEPTSDGYYIISGVQNYEFWIMKLGISTNQPPSTPLILGPNTGKAGTSYPYTFQSIDPENDQVLYYIDWGDSSNTGWIGPFPSGKIQGINHTWMTQATYTVQAQAQDINGALTGWATLTVTMPYNIKLPFMPFLTWLFERFPHAFPLLRQLMGY